MNANLRRSAMMNWWSTRGWRLAFACYAVALFTATHWPKLRLPEIVPRTDLVIHLGAFGTWTLLFGLTEWAGRFGSSGSVWVLARVLVIGVAYGGADELLQGIPGLGRVVAWDDFGANCLGVLCGTTVLAIVRAMRRKNSAD